MARPLKQTVDYFPHYSDASTRKTVYILESKFGNDGYAFWFKLLELLASSEGHVSDVRNPVAWEFLLAKTRVDNEKACQIMELLVALEAIDSELWEKRVIWVQNLVDNISDVYRNRLTDLPLKPSLNGEKPQPEGITDEINEVSATSNTQTKLKKTKENKTKEKLPYGQFSNVLLTTTEADKLIAKFGIDGMEARVQNLSEYIASKGITRYKDHYATILNFARRDGFTGNSPETPVPAPEPEQTPQNEAITQHLDEINRIWGGDLVSELDGRYLGQFQLESNVGASRNLWRVFQCLSGKAEANAATKRAWEAKLRKLGVEV